MEIQVGYCTLQYKLRMKREKSSEIAWNRGSDTTPEIGKLNWLKNKHHLQYCIDDFNEGDVTGKYFASHLFVLEKERLKKI